MSILFINGGEKGGNTSALGQRLLAGLDFDQIDLADHKVYDHGQHFDDDEFDQCWPASSRPTPSCSARPSTGMTSRA